MKVILLERLENLGKIGDEVEVRPGYGRNFLIPQGKALRANAVNRVRFEAEREVIERRNAEAAESAGEKGDAITGKSMVLIRQSGDTGVLYGSVTSRDICEAVLEETGVKIGRSQIRLNAPIKALGIVDIDVRLHADVTIQIKVNVARTPEEAERQAAGEDVIAVLQQEQTAIASEQAEEMAEAAAERQEYDEDDD